jgi:ankyrin repeat protein
MNETIRDLVFSGNTAELNKLLSGNKDLANSADQYNRKYISLAAAIGEIDIVKTFIEAGADINAGNADDLGYTPLMEAINDDRAEMVQFLLDNGADVNATDTIGGTALFRACVSARPELLKLLLKAGAAVDANNNEGSTALHYVCQHAVSWGGWTILETVDGVETEKPNMRIYEHLEIIKILLDHGAAINSFNSGGYSALHFSAHTGNAVFVTELLARGAKPDLVNTNGYSPLHAASDNGQLSCIQLLAEAGADVNRPDGYGFRPIHGATLSGNTEAVAYLLKKGARPEEKVEQGYGEIQAGFSAIDIALLNKQEKMLQVLHAK